MCREGCFSCAFYVIAIYIGTFVVMLDIEANICNDIRELIITATYNGIVLCFRDLESRDQRCTKCDQYERALAKLKKENQELQDRYYILHTIVINVFLSFFWVLLTNYAMQDTLPF